MSASSRSRSGGRSLRRRVVGGRYRSVAPGPLAAKARREPSLQGGRGRARYLCRVEPRWRSRVISEIQPSTSARSSGAMSFFLCSTRAGWTWPVGTAQIVVAGAQVAHEDRHARVVDAQLQEDFRGLFVVSRLVELGSLLRVGRICLSRPQRRPPAREAQHPCQHGENSQRAVFSFDTMRLPLIAADVTPPWKSARVFVTRTAVEGARATIPVPVCYCAMVGTHDDAWFEIHPNSEEMPVAAGPRSRVAAYDLGSNSFHLLVARRMVRRLAIARTGAGDGAAGRGIIA